MKLVVFQILSKYHVYSKFVKNHKIMAKSWLIMSTKVLLRVSLLWMKSKSSFISKDKVAPVNQKPQISSFFDGIPFGILKHFLKNSVLTTCSVTSKNEITNPPIHEFKVLHKDQKAF